MQRWYLRETFPSKSPRQKNLTDDVIFQILLMSAKNTFWSENTHGSSDKSYDAINQHIISGCISGVSFNFIPCVEARILGGSMYTPS